MAPVNISTGNLNTDNLRQTAEKMWQNLDARDDRQNAINKSVWDAFRESTGVTANTIQNYILKPNAIRSFIYYLKHASETVLQNIYSYCGITQPNGSEQESVETTDAQTEVADETAEGSKYVRSNEENLRQILDGADFQQGDISDDEFVEILEKYENKLSLKDSMHYTDEQIAEDIVAFAKGKQFEKKEKQFCQSNDIITSIKGNYDLLAHQNDLRFGANVVNSPYVIEGVQKAVAYGAAHPEDVTTAYVMQAKAYKDFGNSMLQQYDTSGDNLISKDEFIVYETQKAGGVLSDPEIKLAEKIFDYMNGEDDYIDQKEMTLHGYAMSKIFDGKNDEDGDKSERKSGQDITYNEYMETNFSIMQYALDGSKDDTFNMYEKIKKNGENLYKD